MTITANDHYRHPARITKARFGDLLRTRANPAVCQERDPDEYYDTIVEYGIDPLLLGEKSVPSIQVSPRIMQRLVLGSCHKLQVFKTIVCLVSVDMVHVLTSVQRSSNVLLHYMTMLQHLLAIYGLENIARSVVRGAAIPHRMQFPSDARLSLTLAGARAKARALMLEPIFVDFKNRAALCARDRDFRLAVFGSRSLRGPLEVARLALSVFRVLPLRLHMRSACHGLPPFMIEHCDAQANSIIVGHYDNC